MKVVYTFVFIIILIINNAYPSSQTEKEQLSTCAAEDNQTEEYSTYHRFFLMLYTQNEFLTFSLLSFSLFRPCKKKESKACISCKNCKKKRDSDNSWTVKLSLLDILLFVVVQLLLYWLLWVCLFISILHFFFGYLERESLNSLIKRGSRLY